MLLRQAVAYELVSIITINVVSDSSEVPLLAENKKF